VPACARISVPTISIVTGGLRLANSSASFIRFMGNSDEEMTAEECQTAFDEIDTNSDGLIDFAEFLAWWNERA
jgi:hypothetical protein